MAGYVMMTRSMSKGSKKGNPRIKGGVRLGKIKKQLTPKQAVKQLADDVKEMRKWIKALQNELCKRDLDLIDALDIGVDELYGQLGAIENGLDKVRNSINSK